MVGSFDCHIWPYSCEEDETREGPNCFSPYSTVEVLDEGAIPMHDVKIGDSILTASGAYESVYAFGHKDANSTTDFLRIFTDGYLHPLEVTAKHLVFVNSTGGFSLVPAEDIKEGDFLRSTEGRATRVIDIRHIKRNGLYAPFTTDGTLVVDGIVASSYMSLKAIEYHKFFKNRIHKVSHLAVSPIRFVCTRLTSKLCELKNDDGIPYLFSYLEDYLNVANNLWVPFHVAAIVLYLSLAMVFYVAEWLTSLDGIIMSISVAATLLLQQWEKCHDISSEVVLENE